MIHKARSPIPPEISTYVLVFDHRLSSAEDWKNFRKDITSRFDRPETHRHLPDGGTKRGLPLLQYGEINGYAAVIGLQRGCELLEEIQIAGLLPPHLQFLKEVPVLQKHTLHVAHTPQTYAVKRMILPLKPTEWTQPMLHKERIALLEQKLTSALVSYAGEFAYDIAQYLLYANLYTFEVYQEKNAYKANRNYKEAAAHEAGKREKRNVKPSWICLDATFETNLILPPTFTLGKEKGSGYGWGKAAESQHVHQILLAKHLY
jgi:hypothetical protein